VTRERLRIARELHDVVAHSMTVVTVQAGFGEYVFDSQPDEARAALGAIQAVSREALGEMQRMLCVLRQTDGDLAAADAELAAREPAAAGLAVNGTPANRAGGPGRVRHGRDQRSRRPAQGPRGFRPTAPLAPVPGLANLDRLVERTAGAGVTVTVERIGEAAQPARQPRPVRVPHRAGVPDQRGQALRRGPLPRRAGVQLGQPAHRGHRPRGRGALRGRGAHRG